MGAGKPRRPLGSLGAMLRGFLGDLGGDVATARNLCGLGD